MRRRSAAEEGRHPLRRGASGQLARLLHRCVPLILASRHERPRRRAEPRGASAPGGRRRAARQRPRPRRADRVATHVMAFDLVDGGPRDFQAQLAGLDDEPFSRTSEICPCRPPVVTILSPFFSAPSISLRFFLALRSGAKIRNQMTAPIAGSGQPPSSRPPLACGLASGKRRNGPPVTSPSPRRPPATPASRSRTGGGPGQGEGDTFRRRWVPWCCRIGRPGWELCGAGSVGAEGTSKELRWEPDRLVDLDALRSSDG